MMKTPLRIALAQINTIVGDFSYNLGKVRDSIKKAKKYGAGLILFPELTVTGYPPEDLLLKEKFVRKNIETLEKIIPTTHGITAIVGYAEPKGGRIYNSAAIISGGRLAGSYQKMLLPNYGVFDEKRYFEEGSKPVRFHQNGLTFGVTVCEDLWFADGPGKTLCLEGGVDVLLNISSSPYHKGKGKTREEIIRSRARKYRAFVVYANLVGGQDELVFDGQSMVAGPDGTVRVRGNSFREEIIFADLEVVPKPRKERKSPSQTIMRTYRTKPALSLKRKTPAPPTHEYRELGESEELYEAIVLATRDYILKNGFEKVAIGLSGGVDSALTAAVAVDAMGGDKVYGVLMPSPFSSKESVDDSLSLAANLKIQTFTFPVEKIMTAYESVLSEVFHGTPRDVAEENLQARIRGNLLMALSNKFGWLVLTTGNKSEFSVGYCTLYGDMAGGFAVLKDVPKIWVYRLARWVNEREQQFTIPENILIKEPSAELRPNQKDTDSLPPYSLLDKVLERYIEEDATAEDLKGMGLSQAEARRVVRMVDANEYKRRQGPPGVKITPKSFGKDRRLPITNHFKG